VSKQAPDPEKETVVQNGPSPNALKLAPKSVPKVPMAPKKQSVAKVPIAPKAQSALSLKTEEAQYENARYRIFKQYKALKPLIEDICTIMVNHSHLTDSNAELHAIFDIDDTLIFDNQRTTPNVQIMHLLNVSRAHGCKIHLISARQHCKEVLRWTKDELKRTGISYDSLALAPKKMRDSMESISRWKHSERLKHSPAIFSCGDQWGDSLILQSDEDIDALNTQFNVQEYPWNILEFETGPQKYGIKIMAP